MGFQTFFGRSVLHWGSLVLHLHSSHIYQIGESHSYAVAPSFEMRLRNDAVVGHLNSILALNQLNDIAHNILFDNYLEGLEYEGGDTSEYNLPLPDDM